MPHTDFDVITGPSIPAAPPAPAPAPKRPR